MLQFGCSILNPGSQILPILCRSWCSYIVYYGAGLDVAWHNVDQSSYIKIHEVKVKRHCLQSIMITVTIFRGNDVGGNEYRYELLVKYTNSDALVTFNVLIDT
jgi:hypothetical protein